MITAEVIYERLKQLDGSDLEIVNDYIDLMLAHPSNFQQLIAAKYPYLFEDINAAVDYEAGLRK